MSSTFPKRQKTDVIAEIGINIVSTIFNDHFGWIFRRTHQEHDYGIDAYIDYVNNEGCVTGKFIAVQIKTGKSYLSKKGSIHWYTDSNEHLNYFLNLPIPIIIVICDPDKKECYWSCLEKDKIDYYDNKWRFPIPKNKRLNLGSLNEIKNLFGPIEDYVGKLESEIKEFEKEITSSSYVMYSVPRIDIENKSLLNLKKFLSKITNNEKLVRAIQGKLYICTYGYESDSREVFEIRPVRRWALKARSKIKEWFLCANEGNIPSTLLWIVACTCNVETEFSFNEYGVPGYKIIGNSKDVGDFMIECFSGLNEATEKWGWSDRFNYDLTKLIQEELFPDIVYPSYDEFQKTKNEK